MEYVNFRIKSREMFNFIKAGILSFEGEVNDLEPENSDVDPFAELQSEISNLEDKADQAS